MTLTYHPYDHAWVAAIRAGGPDDYGLPAERTVWMAAATPAAIACVTLRKGRQC